MKRRIILGAIAILVIAGAVRLVLVRRDQLMSQRVATAPAVEVEAGRVWRGDYVGELICYGVIGSDRQAVVRARVGGTVSRILAWEGETVAQGDPLVELDGTDAEPVDGRAALRTAVDNLRQSVAALRQTRANLAAVLERDRLLLRNDAISQQQVEMSENRYVEAGVQVRAVDSQLAAQRTQLSLYTVRAPFAGTVSAVMVRLGDVVAPMQPLQRLEQARPCRIRATVAAADLARLHPGDPVVLVHGGERLEAAIQRVHPSAGPAGTATVDVRMDTPPFALPLGASVEVRLSVDRMSGVLMVPAAAVLEGPRRIRVHVVENDTVRVVPVEILARSGARVAVRGDLSPGDLLVLGSDSLLLRMADGVRVSPREIRR